MRQLVWQKSDGRSRKRQKKLVRKLFCLNFVPVKNETIGRFASQLTQRIMAVLLLTMAVIAIVVYYVVQDGVSDEVEERYQGTLLHTREQLRGMLSEVSVAIENNVHDVERDIHHPDKMFEHAERILRNNPYLVGIGLVFEADYYASKGRWYEVYAVRDTTGNISVTQIGSERHDYLQAPWFIKAMAGEKGEWTAPYFDDFAAKQLLTTYLSQIRDSEGRIVGLLGADLSLEWLRQRIHEADERNNRRLMGDSTHKAYSFIIDNNSTYIIHPDSSRILVSNFLDDTKATPDEDDDRLAVRMMAGEESEESLSMGGVSSHVFFCPLEFVDWSMAIVVPKAAINRNGTALGLLILALILADLFIIYIISRYTIRRTSKPLTDYAAHAASVEKELHIANRIQMAMLTKPFVNSENLDLYASLVPAREVGGDLYDIVQRDHQLYFCIGDVSGKGVPAALLMAMAISAFRMLTEQEISPESIVQRMNDTMSRDNDYCYFITLFVGVLDLQTGSLRYCNAGHKAPLCITSGIPHPSALAIAPNLPVGAFPHYEFEGQLTQLLPGTTLFLYTDGLTEAENASHEEFGVERMTATLEEVMGKTDTQGLIHHMSQAVSRFVGHIEQSDDLTMLALRWNPRSLILPCDINEIPRLTEFVQSVCHDAGFGDSAVQQLILAVEEAVVNIMNYAYEPDAKGPVSLTAEAADNQITITIMDSGRPFDPTLVPQPDLTLDAEEREEGGLGIFMIRRNTDAMQYERRDGYNVLQLTKNNSVR